MLNILAIVGGICTIAITVWLMGSLVSWIDARSKCKEIMLNYAVNNTESIYDELITIKQINAEYKRMQEQKEKLMFEKLTQIGEKLTEIEQKKKRN